MRIILFFTVIIALLQQAGCSKDSGQPADMPKLYPVAIEATGDGKPREEIIVTLTAKTPAKYGAASATTDANGVAKIRTYGHAGVPQGEYTVTFSKIAVEGARIVMNAGAEDEVGGQLYQYVDDKYVKESSTLYSITVGEKGAKETFEIGSPVHTFMRNN